MNQIRLRVRINLSGCVLNFRLMKWIQTYRSQIDISKVKIQEILTELEIMYKMSKSATSSNDAHLKSKAEKREKKRTKT